MLGVSIIAGLTVAVPPIVAMVPTYWVAQDTLHTKHFRYSVSGQVTDTG
jgi:hypothetical protein